MPAYTQECDETITVVDNLLIARPYAYVTNSVRTAASNLLRLRRRPIRYVTFDLPPHFGHLEPGDTVWTSDDLVPEAPTGTDRYDAWRLIPLYVLEVNDPLSPPKLTVKCVDLREIYCSWWSPLQTNIGMTDDLNGIAMIDRAGGWNTIREQVSYGVRPPGDDAYQEVLANNPVVDAFGLLCQGGGDTNHLLNSTFSEGGPGNTFTSWTPTTTGAAIAVEWTLYTLIDATGFRRSVQMATYATGEQAYMSQTAASMGGKILYAKVYYKNGGAVDNLIIRIQRSDTSGYWRDSDSSWQGTPIDNVITPNTGTIDTLFWISKEIDLSAITCDITVMVGTFSAVFNGGQIQQLQAVELLEPTGGDAYQKWRGPLPTKATTVTRVANVTRIVNDSAVRVLSPTRGFFKFTFVPLFYHADLSDGQRKYVLCSDFDEGTNTQWIRCWYERTTITSGKWSLTNTVGVAAELIVIGGDLLTRNTDYVIIGRWTSSTLNEHGAAGQAFDIWVNGVRGGQMLGATECVPLPTCNVYLGSSYNVSDAEYADGHVRFVTIDTRCPDEAELLRI